MNEEQKLIFKTIFNSLSEIHRDHLMSHFDKGDMCFIEYEPGKFIGCHMAGLESHHEIVGQSEYWCYGNLKGETK